MTPLAHDIPESIDLLGIGRTKLYAEIQAGRLTVYKVGRKTLIARSTLEEYVAARVAEAEQLKAA